MKIGIVSDVPETVETLRRAVGLKPEHRLVWIGHDAAQAVALCLQERPDLVLMDLLLPGLDGVEATRQIMAATPCAILVVTPNVGAATARVFEAMGHGAIDAVDTPTPGSDSKHGEPGRFAPLLAKIDVIGRLIGDRPNVLGADPNGAWRRSGRHALVAIGASAGGPAAVANVLSRLPGSFPAALVVVQHVDEQFAVGMATWLGQQSQLPVRVAKEGDRPVPGNVLLAGTRDHLALKTAEQLGYTPHPADYAYRPSVDVFFESVGRLWAGEAVGVLLTGMGRDGALGLKALRDKGRYTIAQDRATSAVYGMPKAAALLHAAVDILPIDRIGQRLVDVFCNERDSGGGDDGADGRSHSDVR